MVDEERLREWVEGKLEEGVDEDRIKDSLRNTGHDPSIVDEVKSPFEEDPEVSEDVFQEDDSSEEAIADSQDEEKVESAGYDERGDELKGGSSGLDMPEINISALSLPSIPLVPAIAVLIIAVAVSGYVFLPVSSALEGVELTPGVFSGALESGDEKEGCPDVGVRISDISVAEGETVAEVLVTRGDAEVVLEIFGDGELLDSSSKRVEGKDTIKVAAIGDKVIFRPVGCERFRDIERIS